MLWRKIIGYWKSILVIGAIAYVSLLREPNVILPSIPRIDKWIHMLMYLLLVWILLWDSKNENLNAWILRTIIVIFSIIFGGFIEILQERYCYPRTGDWLDWLADCIGVLIGLLMWIIGYKWYERRMA